MHDSGESKDSSVCPTTSKTCLSICQSHQESICHTSIKTFPSVCQPHQLSVSHTDITRCPSVCQPHESPVHHTTMTTSLSICQTYIPPVCHTINTSSPSICQSYLLSDHHTNLMVSPSICQSNHSSVCHTATPTSPSVCQSCIPSVCHTIIPTSLSVCQLHDLSVCHPTHDVTRKTIWLTVCLSSVMSVLPSANSTGKMPTSIPVQKFSDRQYPGEFPSIHTSTDSSVLHSGSPSVNSSPSAANPLKFPCNYGEKNAVNYLHKNPVKSPSVSTSYIMPFIAPVCASSIHSVCTLCIMSIIAPISASSIQPVHSSCIIAPIHALSIPSINPSDDECQDFPDKFPGTKYGEKSKITVKFPDNIALTLHQVKFLEETPGTTIGVIYQADFPVTQIWVKFMVINLQNYMQGVLQVPLHTMRCVHGSINEILWEWDPGPTYDVQRLWDPGGPTYSSRCSVPTDLDKLGKLKSYLDYIHLPALSSLPFQVTVMLNLAPNNHLGKLDHMGSFRYLPRLNQQV